MEGLICFAVGRDSLVQFDRFFKRVQVRRVNEHRKIAQIQISDVFLQLSSGEKMQSEMKVAPRWEAEGVEEGEGLDQWHICLYIYIYIVIRLEHHGNRLYGFMGLESKKLDGDWSGWVTGLDTP